MAVKGFKSLLLREDTKDVYDIAKLAMEEHMGMPMRHSSFVLLLCRMVQDKCNDAELGNALEAINDTRREA